MNIPNNSFPGFSIGAYWKGSVRAPRLSRRRKKKETKKKRQEKKEERKKKRKRKKGEKRGKKRGKCFFCEFLMKFCPDFATNSRKEWRVSLFQSNLRKQIRKLPKILKSVKIIQYYSILFIRVLKYDGTRAWELLPSRGTSATPRSCTSSARSSSCTCSRAPRSKEANE